MCSRSLQFFIIFTFFLLFIHSLIPFTHITMWHASGSCAVRPTFASLLMFVPSRQGGKTINLIFIIIINNPVCPFRRRLFFLFFFFPLFFLFLIGILSVRDRFLPRLRFVRLELAGLPRLACLPELAFLLSSDLGQVQDLTQVLRKKSS